MELQLKITGSDHQILKQHLYSGDGRESIAVALCGRRQDEFCECLLVYELTIISNDECTSRSDTHITWPTEKIVPYFHRIRQCNVALLKIHSHPGGSLTFSQTDEVADAELFSSIFGWTNENAPHGSAVMLPDGSIFGRFYYTNLSFRPINKISFIGHTIFIQQRCRESKNPSYALRTIQAFGEKTFKILKGLTVGVVGCSGTGSLIVEQLTRLGIGKIIMVDPDKIEPKNLNRIINSTKSHAKKGVKKVEMLCALIKSTGLPTQTMSYQNNLYDSAVSLRALAGCDVIFGCMDSIDGRHLLNQLCTFYIIPYFDLGVKLEADGFGGIKKICGSVHYVQPGMSSLITRGVYTIEDLRAAAQFRKNPDEYQILQKEAYLKNVPVGGPAAVISVNMQISSHAVNEFLNRLHPYKAESPDNYAVSTIDITENCVINVNESSFQVDSYLKGKKGRGDVNPFIECCDIG